MGAYYCAVSLPLLCMAIVAFVLAVREVFPFLNLEDQSSIREYLSGGDFRSWRRRDRAIKNVWNEHARLFPKSRKRVVFALLLIGAALSLLGYPLWYAFGPW